jgi:hypothetical protein
MLRTRMETIKIDLQKPGYDLGQTVYIPQKNKVTETKITHYEATILNDNGIIGIVTGYRISHAVIKRAGEISDLVWVVRPSDFCDTREEAEKSSRFLEVKLTEEEWRLAVGDRTIQDINSPYNVENCKLPSCCANISEVRDILLYCKHKGGLIVHEKTPIPEYMKGHSLDIKDDSILAKLFKQLEIDYKKLKLW